MDNNADNNNFRSGSHVSVILLTSHNTAYSPLTVFQKQYNFSVILYPIWNLLAFCNLRDYSVLRDTEGWDVSNNPVIPSVTHNRQYPLEHTSFRNLV
jgi:hypothetical protein